MSSSLLEKLVADAENRNSDNTLNWRDRYIDPAVMMKWKSSIEVIPADRSKGVMFGTRIYPDGTREFFTLK